MAAKKQQPEAVRAGAPPKKETLSKDEKAPPATVQRPKIDQIFSDETGLNDLDDVMLPSEKKDQKLEPSMVPETPQRTAGDDYNNRPVELPTPSSTSKLEKVQPIDNVPGLSFTPPPQNKDSFQQQARAQRYQM